MQPRFPQRSNARAQVSEFFHQNLEVPRDFEFLHKRWGCRGAKECISGNIHQRNKKNEKVSSRKLAILPGEPVWKIVAQFPDRPFPDLSITTNKYENVI